MRYLTVDGERSGTGVRDTYESGYLSLSELGLSDALQRDFQTWVERYGKCAMSGYANTKERESLDRDGIELCARLKRELPDTKIEYYSDALGRKILGSTSTRQLSEPRRPVTFAQVAIDD